MSARILLGSSSVGLSPAAVLMALGRLLLRWHERARLRRHLAMLDDRMLRDIGLTDATLERELAKPFWRD